MRHMAPRPKIEDARNNQYRIRMTDAEVEKLEYCCSKLNMKKSEVIRAGIDKMYEIATEK